MKKILIALSLILSLTMVSAQPKNAADAQKAVAKAEAAAADAKKAAKPATWIAVAKAYIEAYEQPSKNILTGTPQSEVKIFLKDQKVLGTSQKKCTEGNYTVESYADKDLYYNEAGILDFYLVTKPALEGDMLAKAIDAKFSRIRKYYESVAPSRETPYRTVDVRFDGQIICKNK